MFQNLKKILFEKGNKNYRRWLFPKSKKTLSYGLIFTFITVTALASVDVFFYSDVFEIGGEKSFEFDNFFRLIFLPILNLSMIFLARSNWNHSMKRQEFIAGSVLFFNVFGLLNTGFYNEYYNAASDFSYDVLVLILFSQILFGLTFRTSFLFTFFIVVITLVYMAIDDDLLEEFMFATTFILLVWIPVVVSTWKLERSNLSNFNTISELEKSNQEVAKQKSLLHAGEGVSQLVSWNASKNLKKVSFSDGIFAIYELEKGTINNGNIFEKIFKLVHPEDKNEILTYIQNLRKGNLLPACEHRIILPNGKVKWLKCTIGNYMEGDGFYGTIQDITKDKLLELELKQYMQELKVKNEDLQQFAYASSHDLQEPLRSITNFVNILNKKLGDELNAEHRLYMDIILNSAGRMKNLINAILDYSRLGRNKKLEIFDCNKVLEEVLTDLTFAIENSGGKVYIGNLPQIAGYKTEFSVLAQNLISNALKFRKEDVTPIVYFDKINEDENFHFIVKDNGIGMETRHANRIFQLFSRLHAQTEYEGTGIGLTHCKKITELHGGKIWVESIKNEGSTFHFTIPKNLKANSNGKEIELHLVN